MQLEFITREGLDDLRTNFRLYKLHYVNNNRKWFDEYFQKNECIRKSKFEVDEFEMNYDVDYNLSDYENVKILHAALIDLPLEVASDQRLWSGLAHGQLYDFIRYRRKNEICSGDDQDILNSFFFTRGIKRSNHINCLSRLWWAGHMTYDSTNEDHYELTRLLFKTGFASTLILLSSRNFTSNKLVIQGLLYALKDLEEMGVTLKREHYETGLKLLNNIGSITILDNLEKNKVREIVLEELKKKHGNLNSEMLISVDI